MMLCVFTRLKSNEFFLAGCITYQCDGAHQRSCSTYLSLKKSNSSAKIEAGCCYHVDHYTTPQCTESSQNCTDDVNWSFKAVKFPAEALNTDQTLSPPDSGKAKWISGRNPHRPHYSHYRSGSSYRSSSGSSYRSRGSSYRSGGGSYGGSRYFQRLFLFKNGYNLTIFN